MFSQFQKPPMWTYLLQMVVSSESCQGGRRRFPLYKCVLGVSVCAPFISQEDGEHALCVQITRGVDGTRAACMERRRSLSSFLFIYLFRLFVFVLFQKRKEKENARENKSPPYRSLTIKPWINGRNNRWSIFASIYLRDQTRWMLQRFPLIKLSMFDRNEGGNSEASRD